MKRARLDLLKSLAGGLLAVLCLIWVFHDLHIVDLRRMLRGVRWIWIPLAVACDIGNYLAQGGRWRLLLRPVGRISTIDTTGAIYAGLFVNEVLPLRLGELLRTYLISRRLGIEVKGVVPSVVVERLLDGLWLALAVGALATFLPLPGSLTRAGDVLGVLVLAGTAVFLTVVIRGGKAGRSGMATIERVETAGSNVGIKAPHGSAAQGRLRRLIQGQIDGVRRIGLSAPFWKSFALTGLMLVLQSFSFWFVLLGCRLDLSLWIGCAVFLIVHLGTMIPNAPGNVGAYQLFCVLGLSLFGVEKAKAAAFSVVVFVILTFPLWALGYLALKREGLSPRRTRDELIRVAIPD